MIGQRRAAVRGCTRLRTALEPGPRIVSIGPCTECGREHAQALDLSPGELDRLARRAEERAAYERGRQRQAERQAYEAEERAREAAEGAAFLRHLRIAQQEAQELLRIMAEANRVQWSARQRARSDEQRKRRAASEERDARKARELDSAMRELGLAPGYTDDAIRSALAAVAIKHHPDVAGAAGGNVFARASAAALILRDAAAAAKKG